MHYTRQAVAHGSDDGLRGDGVLVDVVLRPKHLLGLLDGDRHGDPIAGSSTRARVDFVVRQPGLDEFN